MNQSDTLIPQADPLLSAVEVFKTNVTDEGQASSILGYLSAKWPDLSINFDLGDCDRILRVESPEGEVDIREIIKVVEGFNHMIERLY